MKNGDWEINAGIPRNDEHIDALVETVLGEIEKEINPHQKRRKDKI